MSPMSLVRVSLTALAFGLAAPAANAADPTGEVAVSMNMARVLRIPTPASTVIIGNPAIADVTVQDPVTLILTGKSYGRTNLIALDDAGDPIADMMVEVTRGENELLTIFLGSARGSMACEPECEQVIIVGDDVGFTSTAVASSSLVEDAAD